MPDLSRRRFRGALAGVLLLLVAPQIEAAQSDHARQVLVLQSMNRGSLALDSFTAHFRAALQNRAGTRITLLEFVIAPDGLTEAPEKADIEFLQALYADRGPPELIVTVGGAAASFIRNHRSDLFPQTPVLFAALDKRFLRDAPLGEKETAVALSVDFTGIVDDILQLLPETRNVFMVTGSGPLGTFWQAELRENFERYRNRLTFIWSHDLSYEEMLVRAATLPPNSAILYVTGGTFAMGGWQDDERTLAELSTRANAPVFAAQNPYLGAGIVGGHLVDVEDLGATAADVVVRILNGESPGSIRIPPRSLGAAMFDARQLRRWNISEARLPSGGDVRFRGPSLWRDYRREMLGLMGALFFQALLIVGLLYQHHGRRRAEIESRRNLALAADADRRVTMSALTGSIAHELSQPLNSILHNAKAGELLINSNRATPDTLQAILSDIRAADVRATQIVERHRTMLKNHELDKKPVDIHDIVRESMALLGDDTRTRRIQVDLDLPSDPCFVDGDQVLLQQVLVNLVVNAMDAMATITPARRRVSVHSEVEQDSVELSVRDEGTGLPPELNGQLFEPFVTTKTNGIGIGLTITRTIIEAHGGRLAAHNNPDGGATFRVTLPVPRRLEHRSDSAGLGVS